MSNSGSRESLDQARYMYCSNWNRNMNTPVLER